jgi:hypothetical protein
MSFTPTPEEPAVCLGGPAHLKTGPPFQHRRWHCTIPGKYRKDLSMLEQAHVVYEWSDTLKAYIAVETVKAKHDQ